MEDCPDYWKRFAEPFDGWIDMRVELEKTYHARAVNEHSISDFVDGLIIEFDTAQDLTWFLMKWS
jgi:hypothetical protein